MTKSELIEQISLKHELSIATAAQAVDSFFNTLASGLATGSSVELRGFGTFKPKEYRSYTGRNPRTNEPVFVPPKTMPQFKASREIKNDLNK